MFQYYSDSFCSPDTAADVAHFLLVPTAGACSTILGYLVSLGYLILHELKQKPVRLSLLMPLNVVWGDSGVLGIGWRMDESSTLLLPLQIGQPAYKHHRYWVRVGLVCWGFTAASVGCQCNGCGSGVRIVLQDFEIPSVGRSVHLLVSWLWSRS